MKFSIRDMLLVTVIVALAVAWWVDSSRVHARLMKELEWRATLVPVDAAPGKNYWVEGDYDSPSSSAAAPVPRTP